MPDTCDAPRLRTSLRTEELAIRRADVVLPPLDVLEQRGPVWESRSSSEAVELVTRFREAVNGLIVNDAQPMLDAAHELVALIE
jgi:hypothetical protein